MTKKIDVLVDGFNGNEVVGLQEINVRPVEETAQDLIDAFETCRRNCSSKKMDQCEKNGRMPGMPGCRN